jgi:hypothetical protein
MHWSNKKVVRTLKDIVTKNLTLFVYVDLIWQKVQSCRENVQGFLRLYSNVSFTWTHEGI